MAYVVYDDSPVAEQTYRCGQAFNAWFKETYAAEKLYEYDVHVHFLFQYDHVMRCANIYHHVYCAPIGTTEPGRNGWGTFTCDLQ